MRVKITVEKVVTAEGKVVTFGTGALAQDQYVEGENLRFFKGPSDKLVVLQQFDDGRFNQFFTDQPHSTAITQLDAAPAVLAANQWVLT